MAGTEQESRGAKIVATVDEDLRDLIPGYLENRRQDATALTAALDRGDFESIRSLCHQIKGSGGSYGFDGLTEIGRACEDAAKRSDGREVREQLNRLKVYLDNVEVIFQ